MVTDSLRFRFLRPFGVKCHLVREHERGILWRDGECRQVLGQGRHWFFDPFGRVRVEVYDRRLPWLPGEGLDLLVRSGILAGEAETLDLADNQRALAWVNGHFNAILGPGLHGWWTGVGKVEVEIADIGEANGALRLRKSAALPQAPQVSKYLKLVDVPAESRAAFFRDGVYMGLLPPGRHAFWLGPEQLAFTVVDTREQTLDIGGQELLTADKLPVRLNAVLSFRVADVEKSLLVAADARQAMYREAQLILRAEVGRRDLDGLMADKDALAGEMEKAVRARAGEYGLRIVSFGVRDIVLPGDIKALLLKAVEARKASEAATIVRREETAAMRHQLNSAKLLAENPVLMRLRELETLEKVAAGSKLKVILGDKGLREKIAELV